MEKLQTALQEKLGSPGKLIAGSKSGYRSRYPQNLALFNANVCIQNADGNTEKIWWGDIDISKSRNSLREISFEFETDIYVLFEMDGRFENERNPRIDRFVYRANSNGTEALGNRYDNYYTIDESGLSAKTIETH